MITILIFTGLILLTIALGIWYNWKAALALLIPLTYAGYYYAATEVPKYFGYAIAINFADLQGQAKFISGFDGGGKIYLLIIEKGDKEPRLISIPNTPQNKSVLKDLQEKSKKGQGAVLKKKKPRDGKESDTTGPLSQSDIESVDLKEQDILRKDDAP